MSHIYLDGVGVYGALAVQGKPVEAIKHQKIVVVGAGSAGMGVTSMLALGMQKHVSSTPPPFSFPISIFSNLPRSGTSSASSLCRKRLIMPMNDINPMQFDTEAATLGS